MADSIKDMQATTDTLNRAGARILQYQREVAELMARRFTLHCALQDILDGRVLEPHERDWNKVFEIAERALALQSETTKNSDTLPCCGSDSGVHLVGCQSEDAYRIHRAESDKITVYSDNDMSREAREWRRSQGRICCTWHSYMVGDGCDVCRPEMEKVTNTDEDQHGQ